MFLGRIYVVFTLFAYWVRGGGGVLPRDCMVHNLLVVQFFNLYSSKIEVSVTYFFFDTMIS